MKYPLAFLLSVAFSASCAASNIVWISDQLPIGSATSDHDGGTNGVFGPGAGPYPDAGVISLLTSAGHSVTRFNPSNTDPLNAADIATLNASDLLIIARSIASASFDTAAETLPWNTLITKPLLITNTYISRSSRLGWFSGGPTQPDVISNPLTFPNPSSPVSAYLIDGVSMSGSTTNNSVTEAITYPDFTIDIRGTSLITDPLVAGATLIASSNAGSATFIASWPAGTPLAGTSAGQSLSGYRMQFLVGNRESATAPNGNVGSAGFENLTPDGEGMFLRAVAVAANNGLVPVPEPSIAALMGLAGLGLVRRRRPHSAS
jgi:hypothetical protein